SERGEHAQVVRPNYPVEISDREHAHEPQPQRAEGEGQHAEQGGKGDEDEWGHWEKATCAASAASCRAGSHNSAARPRPVSPRVRRRSEFAINSRSALATALTSSGGQRIPHASVTISVAPPLAEVTTGRPAYNASTYANPNGSGPMFGWQYTSDAAINRGTSE